MRCEQKRWISQKIKKYLQFLTSNNPDISLLNSLLNYKFCATFNFYNIYMQHTFKITFVQGIDYAARDAGEVNEYMDIIYDSFCLYSWLIPQYEIRVLDQRNMDQNLSIKTFKKGSSYNHYYSLQTRVINQKSILYSIGIIKKDHSIMFQNSLIQKSKDNYGIRVSFVKGDDLKGFNIQINCKESVEFGIPFHQIFLERQVRNKYNYFRPPSRKQTQPKQSLLDVEYYYIQPESRRYYQPKGYHLNLALQGGGVKGVSYVGVKKAINQLQQRIRRQSNGSIQFPIKSVIGSSAGGILSLAISAGIQDGDLTDLCYMMKTLVQDRLIPNQHNNDNSLTYNTQRRLQSNDHEYFYEQEKGLKNMLHNLGLVQDSLSDIIFETLKQPSVQDKISALFEALNPSLASLLSYEQPYERGSGESINNCCGTCCCCCYSNCCSCGCYPCFKAIPGSSCFISDSKEYKKVNIYGLLSAALMTGTAVQNIIAYALSLFLQLEAKKGSEALIKLARKKNWFQITDDLKILNQILKNAQKLRNSFRKNFYQQARVLNQSYLNNALIDISKTLTLKEYYDLNGVEFTCTSVDLHDKVERFFNHKTAPQLPICRAVQMTGSFPVAFLALTWRRQWGKYYVHYDRTRREISLEGHQFTDGGLLANFPLKFLDNEKFREKYFSHKKVEGQTFLYGFGLDQLQDFPEDDKSEKVSECINNLLDEFKYRLMYKFIAYAMSCGTKQTLPVKNVKLFEFLISLLLALRQSDRNLNKQCFKQEIIQTIISKRSIQNKQQLKDIKLVILQFLRQLDKSLIQHFSNSKQEIINAQFNSIYHKFSEFQKDLIKGKETKQKFNSKLSWKQCEQIQQLIQNRLLLYTQKSDCTQIYQRKCSSLRQKYFKLDVFKTTVTEHHQHQILLLLYELKQGMMKLTSEQFQEMKQLMHKNCYQYRTEIKKIYKQVLYKGEDQVDIMNFQRQPLIKQGQIMDLLRMKSKLTPSILHIFNSIYESPQFTTITPFLNYYIEQQSQMNARRMRNRIRAQISQKLREYSYIRKQCHVQQPIKLHIIFQATEFSHYYFSSYVKLVQQAISDSNIQIDIITCTDYHAIFGVLYVLGYDHIDIRREMYQIRYLFEENKNIDEIYNSKEWMKTSIEQIRSLLQKQWQKSIDPFTLAQLNVGQDQLQNSLGQIDHLINQLLVQRERLNIAFEKIIDYLSVSFFQVSKLSKEKRSDRFEQLLNIGKYRKLNQAREKVSQRIFTHFLTYTINLMINIGEYIFKSYFKLSLSKNWNQETLFKGMVIHSLVSSLKYRFYIYNVLTKAGLNRNITLSNFYQACDKKILLNFNCINTTQQRFSLINRITKPNMPVWAALMACSSMPYLEQEFGSYRQWDNKQRGDRKMDMADKLFKQYQAQNTSQMQNFISGNVISTLPLELMTNQRLINHNLSEDHSPYTIQIAFSFDIQFKETEQSKGSPKEDSRQQINHSMSELQENNLLNNDAYIVNFFNQIPQRMEGKRRFINCFDAIKYALEYICCYCCSCSAKEYFQDLMGRMQTFKIIKIRINSHDNFILNLYYDSLIKLPLRIGTLDFYKINKSRPDLDDTVRQAQKITQELCDTFQVDPTNKSKLIIQPSSRTTIQVSHHHNHPQQQFYRIKFISYTKWRDFNFKYIIQYSLNVNEVDEWKIRWQKINSDYIDIRKIDFASSQYRILLKFTYYERSLISKIYLISMQALEKLQSNPARAIFSLNYREIYFAQQDVQTVNQSAVRQKIEVKSYFLPKSSKYCSNLACTAQRLEYILHKQQRSICLSCEANRQIDLYATQDQSSNVSLIGMQCQKCKSKYCLKCKVANFITKKSFKDGDADFFYYQCPKNWELGFPNETYELSYTPIHQQYFGQEKSMKNICLLCQKFAFRLYHEKQTANGKRKEYFSGLKICKCCLYAIS